MRDPRPCSGGDRGARGGARGHTRERCGLCGAVMSTSRTGDPECPDVGAHTHMTPAGTGDEHPADRVRRSLGMPTLAAARHAAVSAAAHAAARRACP